MNDAQMTLAGNLVDDPELRFTASGKPVAKFRVASTPRYKDNATGEWKDGDSLFLTCTVWRQAAENVAESLQRGMRVHRHRPAQAALVRDQGRREAHGVRTRGRRAGPVAAECLGEGPEGHPLQRQRGPGRAAAQSKSGGSGKDADPWATSASGGYSDEPPF